MNFTMTPEVLRRVDDLFEVQGWPKDVHYQSRYNNFCDRLVQINSEERELIIELSYKFLDIPSNNYLEYFWDSFHCISDQYLQAKERIIFSPLSIDEYGQTKSADALFYLVSNNDYKWVTYNDKFRFIDKNVNILKQLNKKDLLILIDDFVGSGETVAEVILERNLGQCKSDIIILALAAQKEGIENVKGSGINVFTNIIREKGISDQYKGHELTKNVNLMKKIESALCKKNFLKTYSFGRKQSEALINFMNKCPNNSFPYYWYNEPKLLAPFPRRSNTNYDNR